MTEMKQYIQTQAVVVENRIRQDFGNIDELAQSISEYGLIEPIVLGRDNKLIAGERRLRAMKRLNVAALEHGKHFVFNDEVDPLRRTAMEVEENVKRKELSWQEQVLGKQRLLEIMQTLHGVATSGRPGLDASQSGFGTNRLAAMLGESTAQTSRDLELARLIIAAPQLAKAETKDAARKQAALAVFVAGGLAAQAQRQQTAQVNGQPLDGSSVAPKPNWKLYEGDFVLNAHNVPDSSVDLVIVDPPYGIDVQNMAANRRDLLTKSFTDTRVGYEKLVMDIVENSFRVLHPDTFGFFFFDMQFYDLWKKTLEAYGFVVDNNSLIWVKNTVMNTAPYVRYGRSYEPILVARKGSPKLIRPSQRDVIEFNTVISRGVAEQKLYHSQKPVELIAKLILDTTLPDATIVDWCAGSGTAGVAALQNKRKALLFERDATACQIIRSRVGSL